jgi:hypothetical protein
VSVDKDGSAARSHEVEVEVGADGRTTSLVVAPQPARTAAQLSITSASAGTAVVEIMNASGARVALISDVVIAQGQQQLDLPIETLASGMYTVVVSFGGTTQSTQLVIAR